MRAATLRLVANVILALGVLTAVLAFASYERPDGSADILTAVLRSAVILVPSLFMWAVLGALAELVRERSGVGDRVV